jgi:hypothetical protein
VIAPLSTVIAIASLLVAAWCLVAAFRDRAPVNAQMVALLAVAALVLVQAVVALVRWAGGTGPEEPVTFLGYLFTALLLPPAGVVLARMEPTRWGSAILGSAGLVVPVLMLRLQQVWG